MRQEVIWAVVAGILFGLVIAFGIFRINSTITPKGESTSATPSPIPQVLEFKITLDKPENEDVVTTDSITLSGITKPQSLIIVSSEDSDYINRADDKGFFSEEVDLISGVNQIRVTAFDEASNQSVEKVLVVYSSAFEEKEGDRLEMAANKPKAYLGTVTDITDSTIQIRTKTSEIRQISTNPDVVVTNTSPTVKIVKLTDIAIGDFIVAMGYKNGNQVLSSQRILITPAVTDPNITVEMAKGVDVTPAKTTQVLSFQDGKVTKSKSSAIEDDTQVVSVTTNINEKSSIRTVFVLPTQDLTE
jgi:hypothetical protein